MHATLSRTRSRGLEQPGHDTGNGSTSDRPVHAKDRELFELIDRVLDEYDRFIQSISRS
jgi:hypothetical protein